MATYEDTLTGLTGDQQQIIGDKVKEVKKQAEQQAQTALDEAKAKIQERGDQLLAQARKELRDTAKTVRKPDLYKGDKDIKEYITTWDSYRTAMELTEHTAKCVFLTYLDGPSRKKLALVEDEVLGYDWENFCAAIIKALGKPTSRLALRHKLRNLMQKPTESVTEFYARMLEIAADAFTERESREMEAALRETLCAGLRSEQTAVDVMEHEEWSFKQALDYATKRDTAISARKEMAGGGRSEIAILRVEESKPSPADQNTQAERDNPQSRRTIRCFNCNMLGHIYRECPNKKRCYFCNATNHIKRDCFEYKKKMAEGSEKQGFRKNQFKAEGSGGPNRNPRNFPAEWKQPQGRMTSKN